MASVIETTRSLHQDIEKQIGNAISELSTHLTSRNPSLQRDTIIQKRVKQISVCLSQLNALYSDPDHIYKPQITFAINRDHRDSFHQFESRALELIQEYGFKRASGLNQEGLASPDLLDGLMYKEIADLRDVFTPQEVRGKNVDLEPFHSKFTSLLITTLTAAFPRAHTTSSISSAAAASLALSSFEELTPHDLSTKVTCLLRSLSTIDYSTYLTIFDDTTFLIPTFIKSVASKYVLDEYNDYLLSLEMYLFAYLMRLNPLALDAKIDEECLEEFSQLSSTSSLLGQTSWDSVVNHRQGKSYGIPLVDYPLWNLHGLSQPPLASIADSTSDDKPTMMECKVCNRSFEGQNALDNHNATKGHITKFNKALKLNPMLAFTLKPAAVSVSQSTITGSETAPGSSSTMMNDSSFPSSVDVLSTNSKKSSIITPQYLLTLQRKLPDQSPDEIKPVLQSILKLEFSIGVWADLLRPIISDTIHRAERRTTQTSAEAAMDDIESGDDEATEEVGNHSINANELDKTNLDKRLLTPDGRVIPPWLYKLHGLHMTYSCEICGGDIHRGERNFKRHFKEHKHMYMLHCLGITSEIGDVSDAYMDLSKIQQVLDLHDHLKRTVGGNCSRGGPAEEFEDILGNITRKGTQ